MDFGEVVTTSSRAFWNDYEDLDSSTAAEPAPVAVFDLVPESAARSKLQNIRKLVVLEGRQGIFDFASATLSGGRTEDTALLRIGNGCAVHLVDGAVDNDTAVVLSEINDVMQYGSVTEQLLQFISDVPQVITISVEPAVAYKSAEIDEADLVDPCFLRSIVAAASDVTTVKALAEPNLITGIAASLATWCKLQGRSFSSYVAYTNEPQLNSLTTAPILRLLRELGVPCADTYIVNAIKESNLYT